ncbi:MAG: DUF3244 domain-containing protein [Bacteroidales bacterium]|nr:DUF3244 domain-containing protein [Bacteroidales bacterium]
MTRIILLLTILFGFTLSPLADEGSTPTIIELSIRGSGTPQGRHRMPMSIDLEAYYYDDANSLVIVANGDIDASVAIYNQSDLMVDYSSTVPTSFDLSCLPAGTYTVVIEHDSWVATGELYLTH